MWVKNINTILKTILILISTINLIKEFNLYNLLWLIFVIIYSISMTILAERWDNKND